MQPKGPPQQPKGHRLQLNMTQLSYSRDNATCLPVSKFCDGSIDCPDNSDEGHFCSLASSCPKAGCSHGCAITWRGPKCFCARGREPSQKNETACVDQDECEIFGICDQKCTNLEDSYFCDCDSAGYELFDGSHCRAVNVPRSEPASLLFANSVDIKHVFLDGSAVSGDSSAVVRTNETLALDFDHRKRQFCWIEHNRRGDNSR